MDTRQELEEVKAGLRCAVRVWVLADEIEYSEADIDKAVNRVIGYAKLEKELAEK